MEIAEKMANILEEIEEKKEEIKALKEELKDLQEEYRIAKAQEQSGQKEIDDYIPDVKLVDITDIEKEEIPELDTHLDDVPPWPPEQKQDTPPAQEKKETKFRRSKYDVVRVDDENDVRVECDGAFVKIDEADYEFRYTTGTMQGLTGPRDGRSTKELLFAAIDFFESPFVNTSVSQKQLRAQRRIRVLINQALQKLRELQQGGSG